MSQVREADMRFILSFSNLEMVSVSVMMCLDCSMQLEFHCNQMSGAFSLTALLPA